MKISPTWILVLLLGVGTACGAAPTAADQEEAARCMKDYFRFSKGGEEEQALKSITKAINLLPAPSTYRERADLYMNMNNPEPAMADAKSALKLDPKDPENTRTLARVLAAQGKIDAAIKAYDDAISHDPGNGVFRFDRARLYERVHEYGKAAEDYTVTIAHAVKQNRGKFYEARGECYMKTKDYKKAIVDFTGAIAVTYGRSKLLRDRAQAYKMLGDPAMEQKDLKAAAAMDEAFEPPSTLGK